MVQSTFKQPRAGCRKCFMFHLGRDRSRRSSCGAIMPAIDRKCFDCKQTTSHGLLLRVYASRWNWACTAFEHVETKTEEVVFSRRSWLSFIVGVRSELVRPYDRHLPEVLPWLNFTPDPQQVQAERFYFWYQTSGPISFWYQTSDVMNVSQDTIAGPYEIHWSRSCTERGVSHMDEASD